MRHVCYTCTEKKIAEAVVSGGFEVSGGGSGGLRRPWVTLSLTRGVVSGDGLLGQWRWFAGQGCGRRWSEVWFAGGDGLLGQWRQAVVSDDGLLGRGVADEGLTNRKEERRWGL
ncbi:hypothetical protein ACFE04_012936 [Oxalis oulophora]